MPDVALEPRRLELSIAKLLNHLEILKSFRPNVCLQAKDLQQQAASVFSVVIVSERCKLTTLRSRLAGGQRREATMPARLRQVRVERRISSLPWHAQQVDGRDLFHAMLASGDEPGRENVPPKLQPLT